MQAQGVLPGIASGRGGRGIYRLIVIRAGLLIDSRKGTVDPLAHDRFDPRCNEHRNRQDAARCKNEGHRHGPAGTQDDMCNEPAPDFVKQVHGVGGQAQHAAGVPRADTGHDAFMHTQRNQRKADGAHERTATGGREDDRVHGNRVGRGELEGSQHDVSQRHQKCEGDASPIDGTEPSGCCVPDEETDGEVWSVPQQQHIARSVAHLDEGPVGNADAVHPERGEIGKTGERKRERKPAKR